MDFESISLTARPHCHMLALFADCPWHSRWNGHSRNKCAMAFKVAFAMAFKVTFTMAFNVGSDPTAKGFEPLRAEPNGFRVHLLSRSATLSHASPLCRLPLAGIHQPRVVQRGAKENKTPPPGIEPGSSA